MSANFEILAYEETPLGPLCLRRRRVLGHSGTFVTEITLNHEFLMSSYNTASERALASLAIADCHAQLPDWTQSQPTTSPVARSRHGMAFDYLRGALHRYCEIAGWIAPVARP